MDETIAGLDDDEQMMVTIVVYDNEHEVGRYTLPREYVSNSELLNTMTQCDESETLPINVSESLRVTKYGIEKGVEFLRLCKGVKLKNPVKPMISKDLNIVWAKAFDNTEEKMDSSSLVKFVDDIHASSEKCDKLYEVIMTASYMDNKSLVNLVCTKLAQIVRSAPVPAISTEMNL